MTLYNLKTSGDQYRITKFDPDMNVESSYLMTPAECECPAGSRPSCRHRQMFRDVLPLVDTAFFWDFDHQMICDSDGNQVTYLELEEALATQPHSPTVTTPDFDSGDGGSIPPAVAKTMPPLPAGVAIFSLDEPATLHNAIADAVGEPEARISPATSWRRI